MKRFAYASILHATMLVALPLRAAADDPRASLGFSYCPPPVVPSCIERVARAPGRTDVAGCGREVLRFARTLGSYRVCLERESERAVGVGNEAIALFRCLARRQGTCVHGDATER